MASIFTMTFPLFGLILLGFAAGKIRPVAVEGLAWLNIFVIYLALPALFFQLLSKTPVDQLTNGSFVVASMLATYVVFALSFGIGALASRGNISESTVQGLAGSYGNIGYMGPGLAIGALGPEAAVPVALIFSFENAMHFTIAPLLMALDKHKGVSRWKLLWQVFRRIITHPFILATIVGITAAVWGFRPPEAVDKLLASLASAAAPSALFAIGVTIALRPLGKIPLVMGPLLTMKLVIHPLIAYFVVSLMGDFTPVWTYTAVLLASLPTATNVYVIAQENNVWVERASGMIVSSTLLSVVTVSALLYMIANGILPPDLFPSN